MRFVLVVLLILLSGHSASVFAREEAGSAARLAEAERLYDAGEWRAAEAEALATDSAEGLTLAAGAVLAGLMTWEDGIDRRSTALTARAHAEAALQRDPQLAEAHLRLAAAYGFQGRFVSPFRAYMMRLPQQGRSHIETALALDPSDPWAHAMLGAWHMEVARRGGASLLGADPATGLAQYRDAAQSAPDQPGIAYHLALALLAADPRAHADEARQWLDRAADCAPDTAFNAAMVAQAKSLSSLLTEDPSAAQAEAVRRLET